MRVVIDTNILFSALNPKSRYYPIIENFRSERFLLLVSTSVLLEYEEILQRVFPEKLLEHFWIFKRRHWNQYVISADNLYIPITPKRERISALSRYFITSLQESYKYDIFYNLLFNNQNEIIKSLYIDTIEKIKKYKRRLTNSIKRMVVKLAAAF